MFLRVELLFFHALSIRSGVFRGHSTSPMAATQKQSQPAPSSLWNKNSCALVKHVKIAKPLLALPSLKWCLVEPNTTSAYSLHYTPLLPWHMKITGTAAHHNIEIISHTACSLQHLRYCKMCFTLSVWGRIMQIDILFKCTDEAVWCSQPSTTRSVILSLMLYYLLLVLLMCSSFWVSDMRHLRKLLHSS